MPTIEGAKANSRPPDTTIRDISTITMTEAVSFLRRLSLFPMAFPVSAAAAACMGDAAASQAHAPLESLFWCAGSWGFLYPLSGFVNHPAGAPRTTSLLTARVLAALHRRGFAWRTMGDGAMCGGKVDVTLPKGQYRFSMLRPVPEADSAHGFGESALIWGRGRGIPGVAENPMYLIWRWRDCCNTIDPGGY